jgi:hypothetical protein
MSEFKGTKGKWQVTPMVNVSDGKKMICATQDNGTQEEMKANALLISKAPEMLEMLIEVKNRLKGNGFPRLQNEIEQLIKEATEL